MIKGLFGSNFVEHKDRWDLEILQSCSSAGRTSSSLYKLIFFNWCGRFMVLTFGQRLPHRMRLSLAGLWKDNLVMSKHSRDTGVCFQWPETNKKIEIWRNFWPSKTISSSLALPTMIETIVELRGHGNTLSQVWELENRFSRHNMRTRR